MLINPFHIHLFYGISELDKYRIGVFGEFPGVIVHISVAVTKLVVLDSSFARIATVLIDMGSLTSGQCRGKIP